MFTEYENFDAVGLADLIARGEVSAREVVSSAIELAEARNPAINAIVTPMFEAALADVDAGRSGPFAGVPFLIKDLASVEGVRCSFGSKLWADFVPDHDADIVRRYRDAGLVLMGKTNTPEVGLAATTEGAFLGPCRNPHDLSRTPGGSSGGAAAAVAAGIVPAAHATDGGGSIRIPASCCGLVGLKPTRGRTPLGPDVGEGWGSMASGHVVSRTVRDSAALLDATHGPGLGDPYRSTPVDSAFLVALEARPEVLRIGIDLEAINHGEVHPECARAVERTAIMLDGLGHDVEPVSLDYSRDELGEAAGLLVAVNVANNVIRRAAAIGAEPSEDNLEALTLRFLEWGRQVPGTDYVEAIHTIHRASRTIERQLQTIDIVLSPTLLCPPPELGFMDTQSEDAETYADHFNRFWGFTSLYNATGNPAISLPLHRTDDGLPVGVQFAGRFGEEALLLQLAAQLEEATPWPVASPLSA